MGTKSAAQTVSEQLIILQNVSALLGMALVQNRSTTLTQAKIHRVSKFVDILTKIMVSVNEGCLRFSLLF